MTQLLKYHTVQANPQYYWENNEVARQLKNKTISTYNEYLLACKKAGCRCYNEERFNAHLNGE
jgi:hypothetical protein